MKVRDGIYYFILAFTCVVVVCYCLNFRRSLYELKEKIILYEEEASKLKLEQYELESIVSTLSQTDLTELESVPGAIGGKKNVLVLRLSEEICMNCYFLSLQKTIDYLTSELTDSFDVVILGKYRFEASLHNDLKDFNLKDLKIHNTALSLPLDDLAAPYLMYFNEDMELSKFYIFEKGNKTEKSINFINQLL